MGKLIYQQLRKVSEANIWFSQFKLNVLGGDMVSFAEAFLFRDREGEAKFWITLYIQSFGPKQLSPNKLHPYPCLSLQNAHMCKFRKTILALDWIFSDIQQLYQALAICSHRGHREES